LTVLRLRGRSGAGKQKLTSNFKRDDAKAHATNEPNSFAFKLAGKTLLCEWNIESPQSVSWTS
jgi:hypothetical protein